MGTSSGAVESFATQVNTMVTKTKSFLNLLSSYASQSSIDRFSDEAEHFGEEAARDVLQVWGALGGAALCQYHVG